MAYIGGVIGPYPPPPPSSLLLQVHLLKRWWAVVAAERVLPIPPPPVGGGRRGSFWCPAKQRIKYENYQIIRLVLMPWMYLLKIIFRSFPKINKSSKFFIPKLQLIKKKFSGICMWDFRRSWSEEWTTEKITSLRDFVT